MVSSPSAQSGFQLLLVRHGQSANNAAPPEQRVHDTPLTDLGKIQAERLGPQLAATTPIDQLLTSPFLRTLQTTKPIAEACGLTPTVRTGLHETGGCYAGHSPAEMVGKPGMTAGEINRAFPGYAVPDDIDEDGWWKSKRPETVDEAARRAAAQLDRLRAEFTGTDTVVACIAHADFIMWFLTAALDGWPGHDQAPIPNTSVTRLNVTPTSAELILDRSTTHLAAGQISF